MSDNRESALPAVFDGFYEAALNSERWIPALTAGAEALRVTGLSLMAGPSVRAMSVSPPALDELAAEYIAEGWYERNGRFLAYVAGVTAGRGAGRYHLMSNDTMFSDDPSMERLPIQQDFFRRHRLKAFVGAQLSAGSIGKVYLSVDRLEREGPFSRAELGRIELFAKHIDRALQIALALDAEAAAGGMRSLEAVGKAAIMVGRGLKVVSINASAEALLGRGLVISDGLLAATDPRRQDALQRMIMMASKGGNEGRGGPPDPVVLPRSAGRPLVVQAAPYRCELADVFRNVQAIVFITDLDAPTRPPSETLLREAFSLSRAEARLAARICAGATLEDCAKLFELSMNTVRNQLAAIFSKTGVRRQPDLVALLARLDNNRR